MNVGMQFARQVGLKGHFIEIISLKIIFQENCFFRRQEESK
jgi:hypothetical protein